MISSNKPCLLKCVAGLLGFGLLVWISVVEANRWATHRQRMAQLDSQLQEAQDNEQICTHRLAVTLERQNKVQTLREELLKQRNEGKVTEEEFESRWNKITIDDVNEILQSIMSTERDK